MRSPRERICCVPHRRTWIRGGHRQADTLLEAVRPMNLLRHALRRRLYVATISLVAAGACAPAISDEPGHGVSTPSSRPAIPGFPDLSRFIEADRSTYLSNGQRYSGYFFRTPNGLACSSNDYPQPEFARIVCWGPIPSRPGHWEINADRRSAASIKEIPPNVWQESSTDPKPVLPIHHVLKRPMDDLVCGVIDNGTPACRIGDHGFVLGTDRLTLF
jgi:hypothetical protein